MIGSTRVVPGYAYINVHGYGFRTAWLMQSSISVVGSSRLHLTEGEKGVSVNSWILNWMNIQFAYGILFYFSLLLGKNVSARDVRSLKGRLCQHLI